MADNGMLLNFDTSAPLSIPSVKPASAFRGRWTDRLKAKRAQAQRQKKQAPPPATEAAAAAAAAAAATAPEAPPNSKKKHAAAPSNDHSRNRPGGGGGGGGGGHTPHSKPPAGAGGTFVSSLWTGNPEAAVAGAAARSEEQQEQEHEPQEPSNAPLADGSSTFTRLGLAPALASHLLTKLHLQAPTAIQRSAIPRLMSTDSDAFIQAETGSGKTLTYLLPIVDRMMRTDAAAGSRRAGLFAVVLAPTRELSKQIYTVLQTLTHCRAGPHWIVPGLVTGGEKKKSEKARLRKGMNILVATPGRLLDHLQNTKVLAVDKVRWLVLDEGDRLMELGFEEDIGKILHLLDSRSLPDNSPLPGDSMPKKRVTVLCSATMKANVQKLGEISLKEASYIKAEKPGVGGGGGGIRGGWGGQGGEEDAGEGKFLAPAQLRQSYVITPAKLRLVGLNALLQRALIRQTAHPKVIVFFSCTDSVEFHFEVFTRGQAQPVDSGGGGKGDRKAGKRRAGVEAGRQRQQQQQQQQGVDEEVDDGGRMKAGLAVAPGHLLNSVPTVHKLHGSLAQAVRTATLASFTKCKTAAVLFCTDVAARGLDLPNVDLVVQFDPPFSADDHLHRIGRTARAGRDGRAVMFLLPGPEEGYVDAVLKQGIREGQLVRRDLDDVILKGFGGGGGGGASDGGAGGKKDKRDAEDRATEWHLAVERWVMDGAAAAQLAARAWGSHIRAYTTHVSAEKAMFSHRALHYGHLAKSFGLRDKPTSIKVPAGGGGGGGGWCSADSSGGGDQGEETEAEGGGRGGWR